MFERNESGILDGKPVPNVGKMKARIEELEDILYEHKQKGKLMWVFVVYINAHMGFKVIIPYFMLLIEYFLCNRGC